MGSWVQQRVLPVVVSAVVLSAFVGSFMVLARIGAPPPTHTAERAAASRPAVGPEGSALTRVRIADDGSVRVWLDLELTTPVTRLDLWVPDRRGVAAGTAPEVSGVVTEVDGHRTAGPAPREGSTTAVELTAPTRHVRMAYSVSGVAVRTEPSRPTRALALLTPVVVAQARHLPATLEVDSVKVRNLGCAGSDGLVVPCGTPSGATWTVESTGVGAPRDVLAQLDLPVS